MGFGKTLVDVAHKVTVSGLIVTTLYLGFELASLKNQRDQYLFQQAQV
jgi:hypothetical protein